MIARPGARMLGGLALALGVAVAARASTQELVVSHFSLGSELQWEHPATAGWYTVQWSAQATGPWQSAWSPLKDIPATAGVHSAGVPFYFRVLYSPRCFTNNLVLAAGDGVTTHFTGVLDQRPLEPGSFVVAAQTELASDPDGDGWLTGPHGATGFVNYETGHWQVDLISFVPGTGVDLEAAFAFWCDGGTGCASNEVIATGDGVSTLLQGSFATSPLMTGSVSVAAGPGFYFADRDGDGILSGPSGLGGVVNYATGAWTLDFNGSAPGLGQPIVATYRLASCE